jgi:hypothetical protein
MKLLLVLIALACFGCAQTGRRIIEAQTPGASSGAGATLTGPANSAAPSSQVAERRIAYQAAPIAPALVPVVQIDAPGIAAPPIPAAQLPAPSMPAWVYERTETTLGQHQDAADIVKVAVAVSKWGTVRIVGILCIVLGLGGILWSYKNDESGYPLVYLKVAGAGVVFLLVGDNPWLLLLLLLPLGLYAAQKFNLLRLP